MREEISLWFHTVRGNILHVRWFLLHVRGINYDRQGRGYCRTENEYTPGHFQIALYDWPCFTYHSPCVGWVSVGELNNENIWMIYDVRVPYKYRSRGIGTALVQAAISLARRRGVIELCGIVTKDDAEEHP